jgi:hypothetical protein
MSRILAQQLLRYEFMKRLLIGTVIAAASLSVTGAQAPTTNPEPVPDAATLDNHRPLIPKREKPATTRTVSGQVVDSSGQPLEGALVTLTNTATHEKREFFTKKNGRYSFEELSFTVDYQLQARYKDVNGDLKKLSQFDKAPKMVRILEIDTAAPAQPAAQAKKTTPDSKQ